MFHCRRLAGETPAGPTAKKAVLPCVSGGLTAFDLQAACLRHSNPTFRDGRYIMLMFIV